MSDHIDINKEVRIFSEEINQINNNEDFLDDYTETVINNVQNTNNIIIDNIDKRKQDDFNNNNNTLSTYLRAMRPDNISVSILGWRIIRNVSTLFS